MTEYAGREVETVEINGSGVSFILSNDRIKRQVERMSNDSHALNQLQEEAEPDDVYWDVGACFGIHSFLIAPYVQQVVAFEPMPANRGAFMDNAYFNETGNVYVDRRALCDHDGQVRFAIRQSEQAGYGRHSIEKGDYPSIKTIDVFSTTADKAARETWRPNIVKIDVEGAEGLVLDGGKDVFSHPDCRYIIVETHEPNDVQPSYEDFGYSLDTIKARLEAFGFTLEDAEKDYHIIGRKT